MLTGDVKAANCSSKFCKNAKMPNTSKDKTTKANISIYRLLHKQNQKQTELVGGKKAKIGKVFGGGDNFVIEKNWSNKHRFSFVSLSINCFSVKIIGFGRNKKSRKKVFGFPGKP